MVTVQELAAQQNLTAATYLEKALIAMPQDKRTWSVLEQGRTALDVTAECARINHFVAKALIAFGMPGFSGQPETPPDPNTVAVENHIAALSDSVQAMNNSLAGFPSDRLADAITLPFGPNGMTMTFAQFALVGYWNMSYHLGQINFIQTLYGDKEMHI